MGGRAVDCTGLENQQARKRFGGSNPSPSAKCQAFLRLLWQMLVFHHLFPIALGVRAAFAVQRGLCLSIASSQPQCIRVSRWNVNVPLSFREAPADPKTISCPSVAMQPADQARIVGRHVGAADKLLHPLAVGLGDVEGAFFVDVDPVRAPEAAGGDAPLPPRGHQPTL